MKVLVSGKQTFYGSEGESELGDATTSIEVTPDGGGINSYQLESIAKMLSSFGFEYVTEITVEA